MSWKKNVFSYLLWAFYTVMVGTLMVGIGNLFCGDGLPSWCGVVLALVWMAVSGGAAFLLHRFAPGLRAYVRKREKLPLAAEAVILIVLLVLGVVFRVSAFQGVEETSIYYQAAEVTLGRDIPQAAHGAVHIYVWILHLVFLFLGNHFVLGIILQMIFQCIAALLLYYQVRKYIGHIAALTVAGFFTCAPCMVREALVLSPNMLYLCLLAAAGAASAAICGYGFRREASGQKPVLILFFLVGAVSSVAAYLDVAGVLLLLFSVGMIFCVDRELSGLERKVMPCLCCVLGFIAGFACCVAADSLASGKSFGSILQVWFQLYAPKKFLLSATASMQDSQAESFVLIWLMALGIYSFWFDKKRERLGIYMLASCAVILAGCLGIFTPEMPGTLSLYLLFVILAGIGLQQCLGTKTALRAQQRKEDEREVVSWLEAIENLERQEEKKEQEPWKNRGEEKEQEPWKNREEEKEQEPWKNRGEEKEQESWKNRGEEKEREPWKNRGEEKEQEFWISRENVKNNEIQAAQSSLAAPERLENMSDTAADKKPEEKTAEKEGKQTVFLENPLPLPKRHERRVLDFDHPVAEDDDFDI